MDTARPSRSSRLAAKKVLPALVVVPDFNVVYYTLKFRLQAENVCAF
jgi:hypothetical protein